MKVARMLVIVLVVAVLTSGAGYSTLMSADVSGIGAGGQNVTHSNVVIKSVEVSYSGSIASNYIDTVRITAYVNNTEDEGYYYAEVYIRNGNETYIAYGTVYIYSVPATYVISFSSPIVQEDDFRVYVFVKKV